MKGAHTSDDVQFGHLDSKVEENNLERHGAHTGKTAGDVEQHHCKWRQKRLRLCTENPRCCGDGEGNDLLYSRHLIKEQVHNKQEAFPPNSWCSCGTPYHRMLWKPQA